MFMNSKLLGIFSVIVTWLIIVYIIVAAMIFWGSTQRDWDRISAQVVGRNLLNSLFWIRELF